MRIIGLLVVVLLITSCGVKLRPVTYTGKHEFMVQIEEDAPIREICIQWYTQINPTMEYEYRCLTVTHLRELLFKEVDVH